MAGSLWVKIDRRFENLVRSQKREKVGGKPLITCDILAFFRLVTGFEPTDYQVRFLLDPSQFVVARWSRQTGKSLTLSVLCLYTVLSGSDRGVAILAPSLRQGRMLIRRIASFLPKLPKKWVEGRVLKTKLCFVNGSMIEAFPNSPETVRGLTLEVLIVDEANYVEDDRALYDAVVYSLATTNGRFIATSTPGTRDSLFYDMCMNDEEYGDFSRHHVSFHDREMLAEFSSDEEAWLSYRLIDGCVDENLEYVKDLKRSDSDVQ